MMSTKDRVFAMLPSVTLEQLVPADHVSRHLERTLDLRFVRNLVRDRYAPSGRPSMDPVVFFKLQLVLFFEGLRSERQLMRVVADRLSLRWYVGHDLSDALPDHSSLTRIRDRFGLATSRRFFEWIVEQCIAAGLVCGHDLYIDATKGAANADLDSLQPRFAVEAHLAQLFTADHREVVADDAAETAEGIAPTLLPTDLTPQAHADLAALARTRHDWIWCAGLTEPHPAAPIGAPRTSPSVPRPPARHRCLWEMDLLAWAIKIITSSTVVALASSSRPWSPQRKSRKPSQRLISSGMCASAGSCDRARSPATRSTAPSPPSSRSRTNASARTCCWQRLTTDRGHSESRASSTTQMLIPTTAREAKTCVSSPSATSHVAASTWHQPLSAPPACCGTSARPPGGDAASVVVSTRTR